jgi:hypothetical protein
MPNGRFQLRRCHVGLEAHHQDRDARLEQDCSCDATQETWMQAETGRSHRWGRRGNVLDVDSHSFSKS